MRGRAATAAVLAVLLVGTCYTALDWYLYLPGPGRFVFRLRCVGASTFDPTRWRRPDKTWTGMDERVCMAFDLMDSGRLVGRTAGETAALLGPPNRDYFPPDLAYGLGREPGPFGIDSEWMVLRFNPRGRVAAVRLSYD